MYGLWMIAAPVSVTGAPDSATLSGQSSEGRCGCMKLDGKKVIALGERDGVSGPAIAECVRSAGAEPVFVETECFV